MTQVRGECSVEKSHSDASGGVISFVSASTAKSTVFVQCDYFEMSFMSSGRDLRRSG